jgi:hypothetical protein
MKKAHCPVCGKTIFLDSHIAAFSKNVNTYVLHGVCSTCLSRYESVRDAMVAHRGNKMNPGVAQLVKDRINGD